LIRAGGWAWDEQFFTKKKGTNMKFMCPEFEANWAELSERERKSFVELCFAYDAELRGGGRFLNGEPLQAARHATSVRCRSEQVVITDGPFAETKEHIG
jgi:hypothetical protein